MKIIVSIPAYNEELFLDYAISAIYDFADEIILSDIGMRDSVDAGLGYRSTDNTPQIIDRWLKKDKKIHLILSEKAPKTHGEACMPALEMAKEMKGDWFFHVGADEIWAETTLKPMKSYLEKCKKNDILGLNVWMYYFAPDFYHWKDFRNPRISQITDDAIMTDGGAGLYYPNRKVWIYAGDIDKPHPNNTPDYVIKANGDYSRALKAFHYSCVGYDRVKSKYEFYKRYEKNVAKDFYEKYILKDWDFYKKEGYKEFTGKHPEIMRSHPCFGEKLY